MRLAARQRRAWPVLGALAMAAAAACAQEAGSGPSSGGASSSGTSPSGASPGGTAPADALQGSGLRTFQFVPRLNLTSTYTDNIDLLPRQDPRLRAEIINRISPGLRAVSTAGRLQGFFDYTLNGVAYGRGTRNNEFLNALASSGNLEVVDRHLYLEGSASITQQAINPLAAQSVDPTLGRGNRTEVRNLQLAPRLQGQLGDVLQWTTRAARTEVTSTARNVSDSWTSQYSAQLDNRNQARLVYWTVQAARTLQGFSLGRTTELDALSAYLDYQLSPELSAGLSGGRESTDIASASKQQNATYGWRLNWRPGERTLLAIDHQHRFFGNAYTITFSHRLQRSSVSYTDTRSLSTGVGQPTAVSLGGTNYELMYPLIAADPRNAGLSAAALSQLTQETLVGRGLIPNAPAVQSFLSSAATVQRSQQLGFMWLGLRDTLSLSFSQSQGRRVDVLAAGLPDVGFGNNGAITQRGLSLSLSHRLSPQSSASLGYARSRNTGSSGDATSLSSVTAQLSTLLNLRTSFALQARHARSSSTLAPYTESALTATLGMSF